MDEERKRSHPKRYNEIDALSAGHMLQLCSNVQPTKKAERERKENYKNQF